MNASAQITSSPTNERSIGNAVRVFLGDRTKREKMEIEY